MELDPGGPRDYEILCSGAIQGVYVNNGGLHWDRGNDSLCSTYRVQGVKFCKCSVSVQSYANNVVVIAKPHLLTGCL